MPHQRLGKSKAQSEDEEFSNLSLDSGGDADEEEIKEDNWVFPVLGQDANRREFQEVSDYISWTFHFVRFFVPGAQNCTTQS